jgi:HEAT repeats
MMRKRSPQTMEDGFYALLPHAAEHIDELMAEFQTEKDHGLRCWLLELIGEARSEKAFDLLCEQLQSSDESLRSWAIRGLRKLNTKEARRALFDAGVG